MERRWRAVRARMQTGTHRGTVAGLSSSGASAKRPKNMTEVPPETRVPGIPWRARGGERWLTLNVSRKGYFPNYTPNQIHSPIPIPTQHITEIRLLHWRQLLGARRVPRRRRPLASLAALLLLPPSSLPSSSSLSRSFGAPFARGAALAFRSALRAAILALRCS